MWNVESRVVDSNRGAVLTPSASLRATTRVLHLVMAGFQTGEGPYEGFASAFACAISAFSDRLSDKLMLCACLGALSFQAEVRNCKVCSKFIIELTLKSSHDAIFSTLDQVMQVTWSTTMLFYAEMCSCFSAIYWSGKYASYSAALVALLDDWWPGLAITSTLLFVPFISSLLRQFGRAHYCM